MYEFNKRVALSTLVHAKSVLAILEPFKKTLLRTLLIHRIHVNQEKNKKKLDDINLVAREKCE